MEYTVLNYIATFFVGILASFVGSQVGGGGLVSLPFLIFLGLPPQVAIATNKFGSLGLSMGSAFQFSRGNKIVWKYVLPFSVIAAIGGFVGSQALLRFNGAHVEQIIGLLLLLLLPVIFINRDRGIVRSHATKRSKQWGYVMYFLVMLWSGFFGAGGGPFSFFLLVAFFGMTMLDATATNKIPLGVMSFTAIIVFVAHGLIQYSIGFILLAGMIVGSFFGAHIAIRQGSAWLRRLFVITVIIAAIKLLV